MSGFTNDIMNAENVNFTNANPTVGSITSNGQLLIGSSVAPFIRPGFLTSTGGSIAVTNSAGAINIEGSAQGFQPNAVLQEFDDFIGTMNGGSNASKLQWQSSQSLKASAGTANNPGIVSLNSTAGTVSSMWIDELDASSTQIGPIQLGGGLTTINWIVKLTALSAGGNTYVYSIGLADDTTLNANLNSFVNGVYFQYTDSVNSGNWQLKSTNTSVTTTVNTSTAATTAFTTFTISINAAASSVSYYINNVLVGSAISTNIPTTNLSPFWQAFKTVGTIPSMQADLFWITINLSNPRPGPISGSITANNRFFGNYVQTATNYQVLGTDAIIGISSTAAPRTITMPNAGVVAGQWFRIKDESGGAAANNITISGNGFLIDGAATKVITTNYGSVDIYFNGSAYYVS